MITRALGIIILVLLITTALFGWGVMHYHKVSVQLDGQKVDLQSQLDSANDQLVTWGNHYAALEAEHNRVLGILTTTERDKQAASDRAASLQEELRRARENDKCAASAVPDAYAATLRRLHIRPGETLPTASSTGAAASGAGSSAGPQPGP